MPRYAVLGSALVFAFAPSALQRRRADQSSWAAGGLLLRCLQDRSDTGEYRVRVVTFRCDIGRYSAAGENVDDRTPRAGRPNHGAHQLAVAEDPDAAFPNDHPGRVARVRYIIYLQASLGNCFARRCDHAVQWRGVAPARARVERLVPYTPVVAHEEVAAQSTRVKAMLMSRVARIVLCAG